ncbi:hypothetical protein [Methylobacterium oryzae]|uniref:hypothetical protein n=1 Tax=Methylobacterium oryzae TaxID=334852 RepID=UPI001F2E777A|nr:hypothetical protein [Methylobacterium oryzae]UIN36833.1 hypothetical protein LXM90_10185 [Methylobacterium oryzae]
MALTAGAASLAMQQAASLDDVCRIAAGLTPDVLRALIDSYLPAHDEGAVEPRGTVLAHGIYWTDTHYVHAAVDGRFVVYERDDA